jgi:hypothetical protein
MLRAVETRWRRMTCMAFSALSVPKVLVSRDYRSSEESLPKVATPWLDNESPVEQDIPRGVNTLPILCSHRKKASARTLCSAAESFSRNYPFLYFHLIILYQINLCILKTTPPLYSENNSTSVS